MDVMKGLGEPPSAHSSPDQSFGKGDGLGRSKSGRPEKAEDSETRLTSGKMADASKKTLKRRDKMSDIQDLSGHHELSTSDKVREKLEAVKAAKLKEAKRLSDLIGAGQGKDSNPDIDLQPSDNELYNEGPDNQGNQQDIPLSGKAVSFITDLVAKMFAKMQKASPAEILDTTLSKIRTGGLPKDSRCQQKENSPPPFKRRRVETTADKKLVGRHCSQYVRMGTDQSSSDQDEDESQLDQDESDSEDYNQPDQERDYHKIPHSLVDQKTEEILGEEENMVDSMNLTLSEQLFRLRDYFPDKIVASTLEKKNKFFKVQETDLPPIIKGLPVHPIVEDNLEAFNAEIKQGKGKKKKKGIRMENTTLGKGAFPKPTGLRPKYIPSDQESYGESYQQEAGLADLGFFKDKINSINQAPVLRMEKVMQLSEEVKKAMTVTSWSIWFTEANQKLLQNLYDKVDKYPRSKGLIYRYS